MTLSAAEFDRIRSAILNQFAMPINSIHGPDHWVRVELIGVRLVPATGADVGLIQLFSVFHDACRVNEAIDNGHGRRGADLVRRMRGDIPFLDETRFNCLIAACEHHTEGKLSGDPTIGTCWDADRLDLTRIGIRPKAGFLSTAAAKDPAMIDWAVSLCG
jgi:uncharacterized protein